MTQFNTTLTTTAPRKVVEPITVRLMKSAMAVRRYCAAWFAPVEAVEGVNYLDVIEERTW